MVASKDLGEYVRRAMESDGENGSSHQRVRSSAQRSAPDDNHDVLTPSDSSDGDSDRHRELASSSVRSSRSSGGNRKLWIGVAVAAIAALVLVTLALWPAAEEEKAPVVITEPPVREEAAVIVPPPPAPAPTPAPATEIAASPEPVKEAAPRKRQQRQRVKRKRAAAAAAAAADAPSEETQAVPTWLLKEEAAPANSEPRPAAVEHTRVDDVLLADEVEIDRAMVRGANKKKKKAKIVKQDGADLADEYQ